MHTFSFWLKLGCSIAYLLLGPYRVALVSSIVVQASSSVVESAISATIQFGLRQCFKVFELKLFVIKYCHPGLWLCSRVH